jgi:thiol-disulfide isomerase/thioredoxin
MDNKNNIKIFVSVIIILVLGVAGMAILRAKSNNTAAGPGKYDQFATCLKDQGATFYGAFWCPHCQAQKKLFGSSAKLLPYVECSTSDGNGQTQVCIDKKIESYPTWELKDGTRIPTENSAGVTLETLAAKTSCTLPQ